MAAKRKTKTEAAPAVETVTAYKGFDSNWQCRGFQYAVGQTYTMDGLVKACERGFHACEHPLNVFDYYPPAGSRFAEVTLSGAMHSQDGGDTKIAAASITVNVELSISDLVQRAWDWVWSRATVEEGGHATGERGAASATGWQGAASATGEQGAASGNGRAGRGIGNGLSRARHRQRASGARHRQRASRARHRQRAGRARHRQRARGARHRQRAGRARHRQRAGRARHRQRAEQGAASATGWQGAASATGEQGAASATGERGAASATGERGAAMASGFDGRVRGKDGNALFLTERSDDYGPDHGKIIAVWAGIVGHDGVKADTWYTLKGGKPVEVSS